MEILFNNPTLYVIDYPGLDAVEMFDKRNGRGGLMQGAVAERFRHEFHTMIAASPDQDDLEALLDNYEAVMSMSVLRH